MPPSGGEPAAVLKVEDHEADRIFKRALYPTRGSQPGGLTMLSYLYRIATEYQRHHGVAPTLLYLSPDHLAQLRSELSGIDGLEGISRFLGMEMLIDREIRHPHVAWSRIHWCRHARGTHNEELSTPRCADARRDTM